MIRNTGYYTDPDYNRLKGILKEIMQRKNCGPNEPWDWEVLEAPNTSPSGSPDAPGSGKIRFEGGDEDQEQE